MELTMQDVAALLAVGVAAGVLSGFVGVGGGIIMVPAFIWLLGYSQHQAQGTSLAVLMLPVVFLAARNYYNEGLIDVKSVVIVAGAFVISAYFGSKWALALPADTLRKLFGGLMLVVSIKMIFGK